MNSLISDGSFDQSQDNPFKQPSVQKAEDFQATHQLKSHSEQIPINKPLNISSQPELDYNVPSSQGSMIQVAPNTTSLISERRIAKDEDHKYQEVQSNSNSQNLKFSYEDSKIHESSSAKDENSQQTSNERSQDDKIAYYKKEIEKNREQSRINLHSSNKCRDPYQADKYYEEYLRCEERRSVLHNMYGHMLSKQYKYEQAVIEFNEASRIRNQVVYNYKDWGRLLNTQRQESYARRKYEDAEYSQSYLTLIYGNWGWALTRLKHFDLAIQKYSQAIEIDEKVMGMCKKWGYGFAQRKIQEDRKKCLPQIYRNWGYTLSQQEKYREALEIYGKMEQLNFKEDSLYTDMGYCYDKLGDQDRAVQCYRKAIDDNPQRHDIQCEAYYLWGKTLDDKGEHKEAIQKLKEASELESRINERKGKKAKKCSNRLCLVYYKSKKYGEALNLYEKLIDDNHRYAYVHIYIGFVYAQIAYRQSKGEKYFDYSGGKEIEPEEDYCKAANQSFNKGISIYDKNRGHNDDCVNAIEKEIERNEKLLNRNLQNNDELRMIIGMMQTVLQNVRDLEPIPEDSFNFKGSKVQNSENLKTLAEWESLDNCNIKFDDPNLSIVSIKEIDDSIIFEAEHLLESIKSKNAEEQIANIKKYIEPYKAASKDWLELYKRNTLQESGLKKYIKLELIISSIESHWGFQLSILHNYEEALEKFAEAETRIGKLINICKVGSKNWMHSCYFEANKGYYINNKLSGIYKNWSFALSCLGRFEDAVKKSKNALAENPENVSAYQTLGFALSRLGKNEEAIKNYKEALELKLKLKKKKKLEYCPDCSKISIKIGFLLTVLGQFAEASKIYESLINDKSQETSIKCDAYFGWANTLDEEGDLEGAMQKLSEAIKLQESSDEQSDKQSDKQSDLKLQSYLGLLHYHKKDYKKAQEFFEKIISRDESYGFAHINKGLVYNQISHTELKTDSREKEKSNANHVSLFNEYNSYIAEKDSIDLFHHPDNDKIEQFRRCKDDICTYKRTLTEIRKILEKLETIKENGLLEWEDQKDNSEFYDKGIRIVQEASYLCYDYIDVYKREAKKIEKRLKKREEDLKAIIDESKTRLSEPKSVDQKYDFNESLMAHSFEIQGEPSGFNTSK